MNIAVMVKVLPDDQDIVVTADRKLDASKAKPVVSTYDLNAIEAAALLAADTGAATTAIVAGPASVDDSKTKKNILSRGIDALAMAADDALADMDARQTAQALAAMVNQADGIDLVICGDGSADLYAQQVDVQLAEALGWPSLNGVTAITAGDGTVTVERVLENERETVTLPLPAVLSVCPDIAVPRIAGMKDILAAGKKPVTMYAAGDLGELVPAAVEVIDVSAPEPAARKKELFDAAQDGELDAFVAALKGAL